MLDKELKPCPFCGSNDLFVERQTLATKVVQCNSCGAVGPDDEKKSGAREKWNNRHTH